MKPITNEQLSLAKAMKEQNISLHLATTAVNLMVLVEGGCEMMENWVKTQKPTDNEVKEKLLEIAMSLP